MQGKQYVPCSMHKDSETTNAARQLQPSFVDVSFLSRCPLELEGLLLRVAACRLGSTIRRKRNRSSIRLDKVVRHLVSSVLQYGKLRYLSLFPQENL